MRERVEDIYYLALQITSLEQRKVFLERACGADSQLRSTVDNLLAAHTSIETFFHESGAALFRVKDLAEQILDFTENTVHEASRTKTGV